jgi:hypothetical protein
MKFKVGDAVVKATGDYTGPGIVEEALLLSDGRERYVVSHEVLGGDGTFLHIYGPNNLALVPEVTPGDLKLKLVRQAKADRAVMEVRFNRPVDPSEFAQFLECMRATFGDEVG